MFVMTDQIKLVKPIVVRDTMSYDPSQTTTLKVIRYSGTHPSGTRFVTAITLRGNPGQPLKGSYFPVVVDCFGCGAKDSSMDIAIDPMYGDNPTM